MSDHLSLFPLTFERVRYSEPGTGRCLFRAEHFELTAPGKLAIVGENGAGKSLFVRLAHGLIQPQQGAVKWNLPGPLARARQAMVFQHPVMLRRSVRGNLRFALNASKRALDKNAALAAIDQVLARLGLSHIAHRPARRLSGGEQQKLAIGRAWLMRPAVLFMDEPTASLDPTATREIEALIQEIADDGTQIILITHHFEQARRLADQILYIHRGSIVELSATERFFTAPETDLAREFLAGKLRW